MIFPREEPTNEDFRLWESVIILISSPMLLFSPPLAKFLWMPYDRFIWKMTSTREILVNMVNGTNQHTTYELLPGHHATRRGTAYCPSIRPLPALSDLIHYVSIQSESVTGITIHSSAPPAHSLTDLLDTIKSLPNQHLWKSLDLDGDGAWILDGLTEGTVVIVHDGDGSYMEDLDDSACSSGGVIICIRRKRTGTFATAEWTDSETASNY